MSTKRGQPEFRHFALESVGDVTVVNTKSSHIVTEEQIQEFGDELYTVVEVIKPANLLIDFTGVQYLSSTATGKLINTKKKCRRNPTKLMLCELHPELLESFRISP